MLDTLKVGIPLTQSQHKRIQKIATASDRWQWIQCNQATGELRFRQFSGLAATDGYSYHRELRWDIPVTYFSDCRLLLEFSVPKFWYGHNIHLLENFVGTLQTLKQVLERQFGLRGKGKLPDVMLWGVLRADVCYAWRFPTQQLAQSFLDSLKRFHFPRTKPVIRPESIFFQGNTRSVKVYLKLPEFKAHDRKELLKDKASLEWVNHCEALADGVLRFEATLRYRFLKRQGIHTIGDLAASSLSIQWIEGEEPKDEYNKYAAMVALTSYYLQQKGVDVNRLLSTLVPDDKVKHPLYDGLTISAPALKLDVNGESFDFEPQTVLYKTVAKPIELLQKLLTKLIGENPAMMPVDQVKAKLLEVYKPVKAARLVSFWLYVQRFGSAEAKEVFGRDSYYASKSDMKKAGVTLFEPPSGNNVTILEADFLRRFRMQIPSEDVTNKHDDFRQSANVLNFVPKVSNS